MHVVPTNSMDVHVFIGKECIQQAEVKITAAGIEVNKPYQYINKQNDVEMMKNEIEDFDDLTRN